MSVSPQVTALAAALKLPVAKLEAFSALDAAQHTRLLKLLDDAKAKQRAALEAGIDGALSHIPFLLRGPVARLIKG